LLTLCHYGCQCIAKLGKDRSQQNQIFVVLNLFRYCTGSNADGYGQSTAIH